MMHFLSSMGADRCIADADILVDMAHVLMLHKQRILADLPAKQLLAALLEIYDSGIPEAAFDDRFEDIHAGIESLLIGILGEETGGRMHMGRSRNDEVATCLRLRVRDDLARQLSILIRLREVLLELAALHTGTLMPGFTHLQHAQPTTLAHYLLSYEASFSRDFCRLSGALSRVNLSPLGAAAFSSTSYPLNRELTAGMLGFSGILENTMDAVASRDFALEVLADLAIMMANVSRICEEIVIWSSSFVQFVELDDAFCSTSSIMPQKKNPDTAEVMRAKAASVMGACTAALGTVKGLPMSYNRDLQELTPSLWRGVRDAKQSTSLLSDMLATATFRADRMQEEAGRGFSTATDLADHLVQKFGLPFRIAHTLVGRAVQKGSLDLSTLDAAATEIGWKTPTSLGLTEKEVSDALDVEKSVARRILPGAPSAFAVKVSLAERAKVLAADRAEVERMISAHSEAIKRLVEDSRKVAGV